jgi:hypothetical protein
MEVRTVQNGGVLDISFIPSTHSSPIYYCDANFNDRHVHWDAYDAHRDLAGDSISWFLRADGLYRDGPDAQHKMLTW